MERENKTSDKMDQDHGHHRLTATQSTVVGHDMAEVLPKSDRSWFLQPHLISLNLRLAVVLLSATTLGFDGSMMNGLQTLQTWKSFFNNPSPQLLGAMNAVNPIGKISGAIPSGWISDRFGRKVTILIGTVILVLAAVMQAASQNVATFIISRYFIGLGTEFASVPAPVLISELAYPTHRAKVTSLYQCCFYLGAIGASWTTFGSFHLTNSTWSWRIPSLLQAFLPLVQFCTIWFVPESPRWLIKKGRASQARAIIAKHHAAGDDSAPLVDYEMREMTTHMEIEAEVAGMGWSSLWKTRVDQKRFAIAICVPFLSQWTGTGIVTYYLALVLDSIGITDSFHQSLINGILQIFNFFASILGAVLVDRVGRRPLWLFSVTGMIWSFTVLTVCSAIFASTQNGSLGIAVLVFLFIYYFHYDIAVTPLTFAYPVEILPFHTRQKGMALVNLTNGCLLIFNSFVNPIALSNIAWRYYIVYIALLAFFAVIIFLFFPETRGHSLEAIADIFDGPTLVFRNKRRHQREDSEGTKNNAVEMVEALN